MLDLDRLIDALDLVELATRANAKLHKAGREMRSTCPLHAGSDNPTSFCIHTPRGSSRQLWVCHKCGCGDALSFIMRWQGLDFMEAVKWGAQEARIPLTELGLTDEAVKEHQAREKRRDVLDVAARFYQRQFRRVPDAIRYAWSRGFSARTLTRFGYSNGRGLGEYLTAHNADLGLAREIGLLRSDGRDFTSNHDGDQAAPTGWLIYIHRRAGRVDYLSARALKPADPNDKSRNIPGHKQLYRCETDQPDETVVLVEGQADAETLRQIGVSACALCGTSLDDESDLTALRRRKVYLSLDDDTHREGGEELREARRLSQAARLQKLADKLGPLTLIAPELPSDKAKDPNEWLQLKPELNRKDALGWLSRAQPWVQHRIDMAKLAGPLEQAEHICEIAHLLARLPEPVKAKWYKAAGKALDMTPAELKSAAGQDGHGAAAEIKDGQICMYGVPLLTGVAWITREISLSDGANAPKVNYLISGRLKTGETLHEIQVPAAEFESLTWMSEWGARLIKLVSRGRYHEVVRAIQEISLNSNGNSMKRENVFTHTGLGTVNGERSFFSKSGRLTANGLDPQVRVDFGEFALSYALPDPPRGEALRLAVQAAVKFLAVASRRVTAPLFACAAAAALTTVRPLNTIVWVYGTTTTGKSIIVHLMLAFFAPGAIGPRRFNPMIGWNSTLTTLEAAMFMAKDVPLCIDDYAPQFQSKHDADALRGTADRVIRSLGNRMARGRSRSDESVRRVRNPRALVLATAENPIEGQSLNHRLVYIAVEKGDVIKGSDEGNALLADAEEAGAAGLYAQAMAAFIRWLLADWDKHAEQFGLMVDADVAASRGQFASGMDRQPDYFAVLNSAQRLMLKAWADMGALDKVEAGRLADENREAILQVVQGQAGRIAEQSPAVMFIKAVDSMLEQRKAYLAPRKSMADWTPPDRAERIGWFDPTDHGAIWLHTDTALAVAKAYWERLDLHFDVSRDSLRRLLVQSGYLRAQGDAARAEVAIWTGSRTERALEIDVAKVLDSEALGLDLSYPKAPAADETEARHIKELL
jgi:DNA primase